MNSSDAPQEGGPLSADRRKRRDLLLALLALSLVAVTLFLALELGARAFYAASHDLSFLRPHFKERFYPPTRELLQQSITEDDGTFDILLLGASVLHPRFGSVASRLENDLSRYGEPIRIHNVSQAAHTSLDSLLKYRLLNDQRFDLVVYYEAINEARANNIPDTLFRPDYRHISWYELVQHPMHDERRWSAFAYLIEYSLLRLRLKLSAESYINQGQLREDWVQYGSSLKSAKSFRANLRAIIEIARERSDPVLLVTYAIDVEHPIHGTWGAHENTIAAVRAHNRELLELAEVHRLPIVDQDAAMPRGEAYFYDICHLTDRGSQAFVDTLVPGILKVMSAQREKTVSTPQRKPP